MWVRVTGLIPQCRIGKYVARRMDLTPRSFKCSALSYRDEEYSRFHKHTGILWIAFDCDTVTAPSLELAPTSGPMPCR